jgi:fatty-acyl-CoA synthase
MVTLLQKLYRTRLLSPTGLFYLTEAVLTTGINLMALLRIAAKLHPRRTAVIDDQECLTYPQLWQKAECLAMALQQDYGIRSQQKVAIACRNHTATIKAIFAASRLGAHVFLLNPEMSTDQMEKLVKHLGVDFLIYDPPKDEPLPHWLECLLQQHKALPAYHVAVPSVDQLASTPRPTPQSLKTVKTGNIIVMTGGTTGQPKAASRKPSLFNFLPPFVALLERVHLDQYSSVYIATPIYHGFGLAAMLIGIILGTQLHLTQRFDAARACALIAQYQIQVITLVPLMLHRMLKHDPTALSSLQRILTGGAALNPVLAQDVLQILGPILFNLYGTSEAGFCILGTPTLLRQKPASIGQPVWGVKAQVLSDANPVSRGEIGRLCICSTWSTNQKAWIETGDLAYQDLEGDLFLCGRIDDMIVSGGENVYPIELENILLQHPELDSAVVFGIPDQEFGQRLKAVVVKKQDAMLDPATLKNWLKPRIARHQMPAVIEFCESLPYTALGKPDKKALRDGG